MIWYPPILSYHRVDPGLGSDTPTVSPATFEKQMAILRKFWTPIPLSDLMLWLEARGEWPSRAVAVTFDDGTDDTFTHAFPVLQKFRIPATVFMIAGNIGKPGSLNADQIRMMSRDGITFGSHTVHHAYLPSIPIHQAREELQDSKRMLEGCGLMIDFLSYPAGGYTAEIEGVARATGYRAAFTTNRGERRFPMDRWAIRRVTMHGTRSFLGVWLKSSGYYEINHRIRPPA